MNCTPIAPREGEFFGREQGFKDSADNPACSGPGLNEGYVHVEAQATSASSTLCPPARTWRRSAHTRRTRLQDARPVAEVRMSRGPHQHGARDGKIIVVS